MFTKVGEIVYRVDEKTNKKDIGKKYVYTDDLDLLDIVKKVEESDLGVRYVEVSVDDEYTYGAGKQSFKTFYANYDYLLSIKYVSFDIEKMNSRIVIYPDIKEAYLNFRDVDEVPSTEITDIISGKRKFR